MDSEFLGYLRLGLAHIADPRGYDHILFVAALTGGYALAEWRRLLWLVTAFTLGHSVTLALATLGLVRVNATLVEVLIPVTIIVTSVVTVVAARRRGTPALDAAAGAPRATPRGRAGALYALAAAFGLIHGLGFSSFLRALLGEEEGIALPLLAFNVGLEVGQLLIVAGVLLVGALVVRALGGAGRGAAGGADDAAARRDWVLLLCGATAGVGLTMVIDRLTGA